MKHSFKEMINKLPRKRAGWALSVLSAVLIGVFVLFSGMAISPGRFTDLAAGFCAQPLLWVLNALPVFAVLTVLWALFGNVFAAGALTLVITDLLSYVNLLKIEGRDDPFVPADVMLVREGLAAAGEYELKQYPVYIAGMVFGALALAALALFVRTARPKALWRSAVGIAVGAAFVISVPTVYADSGLYSSFTVPSQYNIASVFNTLGFNYCFLHNFNLYPVDKPEGYSTSQVQEWLSEDGKEEKTAGVAPNVIFIMCEAFSDIANDPALDYPDGSGNPLAAYNEIAASGRAYSAHLVVSDFGAGTANTEFDVLTGLPTRMLSAKTTSAFRTVRKDINSVPRFFARQGYSTYFMHPGDSWFYNRASVYSYFGIDDQVFKEDAFTDEDIKGNMVSDAAFLREFTEDIGERMESESPLFSYAVTIQNHQAYSVWKYNDNSILEPTPTSRPLTGDDMAILNIYLYGLRDSVDMLVGLTEYLDSVDEPTLLVFFGDHRPTLGADYSVYKGLGMNVGNTDSATNAIETNKTPLLLWANEAYADDFNAALPTLDLPEHGLISDHYLGAMVTELVGYEGYDGYYDFLNEARRTLPVVCGGAYMRADGSVPEPPTAEEQLIVDKTHAYLYYRMKEEKVTE